MNAKPLCFVGEDVGRRSKMRFTSAPYVNPRLGREHEISFPSPSYRAAFVGLLTSFLSFSLSPFYRSFFICLFRSLVRWFVGSFLLHFLQVLFFASSFFFYGFLPMKRNLIHPTRCPFNKFAFGRALGIEIPSSRPFLPSSLHFHWLE